LGQGLGRLRGFAAGLAAGATLLAAGGGPALGTGAPGAVPAVSAAAFNDVSGDPYATAIDFAAGLGIAAGFPDGGFHPAAPVTREQFAAFVVRELGDQDLAEAAAAVRPDYADAGDIDPWAYGYVDVAQALDLFAGYPDGSFRPGRGITVAEAVTVLVRLAGGAKLAQGLPGGWPAGDLAAARAIDGPGGVDLLSGVRADPSAPAPRDVVAQLLFDAGQVDPVAYGEDGGALLGAASGRPPLFQGRLFTAATGCGVPFTVTGATADALVVSGRFAGCEKAPPATRSFNWAPAVTVEGAGAAGLGGLAGEQVDFAVDARGDVSAVRLARG
jgi:hypothetical protein